ncbi:MAG: acyl carrier protein [Clostridia bacterium]|nr:acyl carrier protein [Clostridia bacterium]
MVFEKVQQLLSEQLNVAPEKITLESNIVADLHADSLDVVEMLMTLEDNFNIQVEDEDAANLLTVGAIVEYIEKATK